MANNDHGRRGFVIGLALLAALFLLGLMLTVGGARQWADRPLVNYGAGNQS